MICGWGGVGYEDFVILLDDGCFFIDFVFYLFLGEVGMRDGDGGVLDSLWVL